MLGEFAAENLKRARYKLLKDGSYFGEIPGLRGVWASSRNLEDCRKELQEVLEGWLPLGFLVNCSHGCDYDPKKISSER